VESKQDRENERHYMLNPVLQSESFESAAYALTHALENPTPMLDLEHLERIVREFGEQVTRFRDIVAAHADNMQRAHTGQAMACDGDTIGRI
jgi:hypothetical protein